MSALSQRLLLCRRDLELNQEDLAIRSGISQSHLSRIERGRTQDVALTTVEALATALGVRPEYLLGWSDDPTGEDKPASLAEGRVVYQVDSPAQYRQVQELLDTWQELTPEDQRMILDMIKRLRTVGNATRIIGT